MQAVVTLPEPSEIAAKGGNDKSLCRKICGIPLLTRVLATAQRGGCTSVLLLRPKKLPESWFRPCLESPLLSSLPVDVLTLENGFQPARKADWEAILGRLDSYFLWLPWNHVLDKKVLRQMVSAAEQSQSGARCEGPRVARRSRTGLQVGPDSDVSVFCIRKNCLVEILSSPKATASGDLLRACVDHPKLARIESLRSPAVVVDCCHSVREAERELVRRSGKDTDGIYSRLNRRLCWPAVRWLSKTGITPNQVTLTGLLVALASAVAFAQGKWSAYVLGALLYFVAVLFDEMDGMVARITFRESPFGCWLETFADYASYFLLFAGMTFGLYRESGLFWLGTGLLILFGSLVSFYVVGRQRKLVTDPARPQEYRRRLHRALEDDKGSLFSRLGRQLEFLVRKPAFCHYVLFFTLFGGLKILFLLTAFGANLVWMFTLYSNRLFRGRTVAEVAR